MSNTTDNPFYDQEALLRRIRALLAHKRGSANEHEAAAAGEIVQRLLRHYNVSMSQVEQQGRPRAEIIIRTITQSTSSRWHRGLAATLAQQNYCRVLWYASRRTEFLLIGEAVNIDVVVELYTYLAKELMALASAAYAKYHATFLSDMLLRTRPVPARTYHTNFLQGAINVINARLADERAQAEGRPTSNQSQEARRRGFALDRERPLTEQRLLCNQAGARLCDVFPEWLALHHDQAQEDLQENEPLLLPTPTTVEEQEAQQDQSRALVVVKDQRIEDFIKKQFGKLRKGRAASQPSRSDGYSAGQAAGKQVNLHVRKELGGPR